MGDHQSVPDVDFSIHPAFSTFPRLAEAHEERVREQISKIEDALICVNASEKSAENFANAFSEQVGSRIAELTRYLDEAIADPEVAAMCRTALETTTAELAEEGQFIQRQKTYRDRLRRASAAARSVAAELERDGVAFRSIEPGIMREMRQAAQPHIAELKERAAKEVAGRNAISLKRKWPLWKMIEYVFKEFGFVDGVSIYSRHAMEFWGGSIEYSHDRQTWWRGCYADVGVPNSATTYMHIDYGYASPKSMIILSNADPGAGTSSFVLGSHKWLRSEFVSRVQRVLDGVVRDPAPGAYYRPRYRLPNRRRQLMLLPASFRGSSHFGDDLLDGGVESERLLSQERYVTPDVGNMAIFDGGRTLHRGALVRSGERVAMQLIFMPLQKKPLFARGLKSVGKALRQVKGRSGT